MRSWILSSIFIRGTDRSVNLPCDVSEEHLLSHIGDLNRDPSVHGILVQLPLPSYIDEQKVIAAIAPEKDVDGFHPVNAGKLLISEDVAIKETRIK